MAPEPRHADPALFGTGRAYVQPQPKGVVGNIVPWNFPFDLSVGPLVEMLAAGNRVMIKPSEYTPACGELLREMVRATFDRDRVDVVVGGLELAQAFSRVRWDHLLYTGSPAIGREIAKAAAEQLVPVTLELGGKCPAILAADASTPSRSSRCSARRRSRTARCASRSTTAWCRATQLEEFADARRRARRASTMPGLLRVGRAAPGSSPTRHLERIERAARRGARRAAPTCARSRTAGRVDRGDAPAADLAGDRPARGHRAHAGGDLRADPAGQALRHARRGDRATSTPASARSALYVFAKDEAVAERGAAADDLGRRVRELRARCTARCRRCRSAASGRAASGRHHGIEGFREFSNLRGGLRARRGRPDRGVRAAVRPDRPGGRRRGVLGRRVN